MTTCSLCGREPRTRPTADLPDGRPILAARRCELGAPGCVAPEDIPDAPCQSQRAMQETVDDTLLAFLARRPATTAQAAQCLGVKPESALKRLQRLEKALRVTRSGHRPVLWSAANEA